MLSAATGRAAGAGPLTPRAAPHWGAPTASRAEQHRRSGGQRGWGCCGSSRGAPPPPPRQHRQRQRRGTAVCAAAPKPGGSREQLPIFPLSIVALPAADVPLQIFEARYRVLFSTLLGLGAKGIEEGLVNTEKAWCGSRLFGMAFYDPQSQGLASMGTLLEITGHEKMEDGRILVNNVGRQRFRILEVVEDKPVLLCNVEYLPDDEDATAASPEAAALAGEVAELFRSVVSLSVKLKGASVPPEIANPAQLRELDPCLLSFWVGSLFAGNPYQQQALLEEATTLGRLTAVQELLSGTVKYLSAQAALQSAFKTTGGGGTASPPPGGPD